MRAAALTISFALIAGCSKAKDTGSAPASTATQPKPTSGSGSSATPVAATGSATGSAAGGDPAGSGSAATPVAAPPSSSKRDPAAAQAANGRGMKLLGDKKYKDAMAAFEQAIAADDRFVLAHYNLACAASRAHDADVAQRELVWVGSAASWDDAAARAASKAAKDPDLAWVLQKYPGLSDPDFYRLDLLSTNAAVAFDDGSKDPTPPAIAKLLKSAPGKHDDGCDPSDPKQSRILGVPSDPGGKRWVYASLGDGVALVEGTKILSRTEPLGCTGPGASQDQLQLLVATNGPEPGAPGLGGHLLFVAEYGSGGRRSWTNDAAIFAINDANQLVRIFDATIASSDDETAGTLVLTASGDVVLGQPGAKQKRVFRWHPEAFKYEEVAQ